MAEASGLFIFIIVIIAIVLAVAALVMPLYVIAIHGQVRRIREMLEEMK